MKHVPRNVVFDNADMVYWCRYWCNKGYDLGKNHGTAKDLHEMIKLIEE